MRGPWRAHPALRAFDSLPLKERLFVRGRLYTAPLQLLAERAPAGTIIDVGCGHGVLSALLLYGRSDRTVIGIDPDGWKVAQAKASVGREPRAQFQNLTIEAFAANQPAIADGIVVADVLYLLPPESWPSFFAAAKALLKPGGRLLVKEAERDGTWKEAKALWQEELMVRLLRRTHSSGALSLVDRRELQDAIVAADFDIEAVVPCGGGYSTPHVMLAAVRR